MCSEAVLHWKKQIHFSCFECFVITVNREHRMIPYFISLYTYHVRRYYVTDCEVFPFLHSHSKYVQLSWSGQSKHRQSAGHIRARHYLWCFNQRRAWTPVGRSQWHNIRSSEMQNQYAMLIPLQMRHYCLTCLLWALVEDSVFTFVHTALRNVLLGQVQRAERMCLKILLI